MNVILFTDSKLKIIYFRQPFVIKDAYFIKFYIYTIMLIAIFIFH